MIIGNPDKFAFWIEKVSEWSNESFVNGLLYAFVNGEIFPKKIRTTTLSSDLYALLEGGVFSSLPTDEGLFALPDKELFDELRKVRYPACFTENENTDEDYRYDIDLHELSDCGYHIFAVSDAKRVRILIGYWENCDCFDLVNSAEITRSEFFKLRGDISEYRRSEIMSYQN